MNTFYEQLSRLSPEKRALFEKKLAQQGIENALPDRIAKRPKDAGSPLSFSQQRLWFVQQLEPQATTYNVPSVLRLTGTLHVKAMQQAIDQLVDRHETLRTRFHASNDSENGTTRVEQIAESAPKSILPLVDLSVHSSPEDKAKKHIKQLISQPFDLSQIPLRTALIKLTDDQHLLVLATHHIVSDRWSVGVFMRELAILYKHNLKNIHNLRSLAADAPTPLTPLPIQYADYAYWQRQKLQGEELKKVETYWQHQLAGDLPCLELPHDRVRPKQLSDRGAHFSIALSPQLSQQLRELAKSQQVTLFVLLLAAFKVLLYRYSHSQDITVGTDIANRDKPETKDLIGLLVNTLVLRTRPTENISFLDFLQQVRQVVVDAMAHQALPFERLVEILNPERHLDQLMPLFQAKFDLQLARVQSVNLDGLTLSRETPPDDRTKYELRFNLQDTEAGINGQIEYSSDLFDESTIAAMATHYQTLLQSIIDNSQTPICSVNLIGEEERQQLIHKHNQTQRAFSDVPSLVALFEQQVARTPDAIALRSWDNEHLQALSYAELNEQANYYARHLRAKGVVEESTVGICMSRSPALMVAILAVLKSGGCYVPLDPNYPEARLKTIALDAQLKCLLVDDSAAEFTGQQLATESSANVNESISIDLINISASRKPETNLDLDLTNLEFKPKADQLAYIIYTSGSTGKPKGVAIEHRNAVAMIQWAQSEFSPQDTQSVLAATSICFDLSVYELFLPLAQGGTVSMVENALTLAEWNAQTLADSGITLVNTVPSVLNRLLNTGSLPTSVKVINLAGEALPPTLLSRLHSIDHIERVYNLYGPSEDTTYSTWARFPKLANNSIASALELVPIGLPISNTQAYVLDQNLKPVPYGVTGELFLGGAGVARGYFRQQDLTNSSFIVNPFSGTSLKAEQDRLYKTGDLVKRTRNGQLLFLGRKDHQVKIRGYRIETGEIDHCLRQHPDINEVVVTTQEIAGELQLVAFIEAAFIEADFIEPARFDNSDSQNQDFKSQLQHYLKAQLPGHLIPAFIEIMEQLPRLPNGKIDRNSLPLVTSHSQVNQINNGDLSYRAPRNPLEKQLAQIWQTVLQKTDIGINDSFFALGGHSLLAMDIVAQCQQKLGVSFPLKQLFNEPTIAGLSAYLQNVESNKHSSLNTFSAQMPQIVANPEAAFEPFALTDIQQAYLIGRNAAFELGNVSTHGYREIEISHVTVTAVEQALNQLIARHAMLRVVVADSQQRILPEAPYYTIEHHQQQDTSTIRDRLSHQMFDTSQWPLFAIEASQIDTNRVRFHLSFDVLIGDAWSFQLLGREFAQLLLGMKLPPLELSFRDYVLAEKLFTETSAYQTSLAYWQDRLDELPASPDLPLTMAPSQIKTPQFARRSGQLTQAQWQRVQQRAAEHGITPSSFVLSVFAETLAAFGQRQAFTLNLTLFNRQPVHPQVNQIVGDFTASLLLAVNHRGEQSFIANAKAIQQQLWQDLEHRAVSGVQVQRELARKQQRSGGALMPVVFTSTLNQSIPASSPSDWQTEFVHGISQTSQVYLDHQVSEVEGGLQFNWDAIENLFPEGFLDLLHTSYTVRLHDLSSDAKEWTNAWQQPWPANRFADWLPALNDTQTHLVSNDCLLHELFFKAATQYPQQTALINGDTQLTYSELAQHVLALARQLQSLLVQPNELVAIGMLKGWQQVVATLGIMTAGAAYVPIDPTLPITRRQELIADTEARILLRGESDVNDWPEGVHACTVEGLSTYVDRDITEFVQPKISTKISDLAYVIYTSGSTGKPKGVMIDHRGATNTVLDVNQRHGVNTLDRVFGISSLSFDLSVYDIFGTLAAGATLVLPQHTSTQKPQDWLQQIAEHQVTIWNSVPALMQLLTDAAANQDFNQGQSLRKVMLSGDWIPLTLPQHITDQFSNAHVISMGGATEASIWSIDYPITEVLPEWNSIPYGCPLANQQWFVLDKQLRPCPPWVTGDLYISGIGLAKGYWQRQELTAQQFIPNPLSAKYAGMIEDCDSAQAVHSQTLYKTGDLGCYRTDGNLEFKGRADFQVKLNGYRIELGEIEAVLQQHPSISAATVTIKGNPAAVTAYFVPKLLPGQNATDDKLSLKQQHLGWRQSDSSTPNAAENVALPDIEPPAQLISRQSHRRFLQEQVKLTKFAKWLAQLRAWSIADAPMEKYRYPSAGNSYPLQAYVQVKANAIEGLNAGWYYYHPGEHQLVKVNHHANVNVEWGRNQQIHDSCGFGIFLIANMKAITPMYGDGARDLALIESGYVAQALMDEAPDLALGTCPIGGSVLNDIHKQLFSENDSDHLVLHGLLGGAIDPNWNESWQALSQQGPGDSIAELQQWLKQRLPAYMVPTRLQPIAKIPLTANGKVDRKALPDVDAPQSDYIAPTTTTEKQICELWQTFIKVPRVGIEDDFFAVGGNSLIAMQLMSNIQKEFSIELSLGQLYNALTPGKQAKLVDELQSLPVSGSQMNQTEPAINALQRDGHSLTASQKSSGIDIENLSDEDVDAMLAQLMSE
ncbi:MAG: amino acid adenylation domain-containing protein [Pseudomonadales bacterium]|nr:amino acid adenylation domain-containing protein [Pseudomonadales bacterium]